MGSKKSEIVVNVNYAISCALTDLRLGISYTDYVNWCLASDIKRSTARNYWNIAKRLLYLCDECDCELQTQW